LKAAAKSGLNAYKQRMHAGFVTPQAAGVPAMLFSPTQRVALLKGSLEAAASRYAGSTTSSSSAKQAANADRYSMLFDLAGGKFDANLEEPDRAEIPAQDESHAFFDDQLSYASESDDDESRRHR